MKRTTRTVGLFSLLYFFLAVSLSDACQPSSVEGRPKVKPAGAGDSVGWQHFIKGDYPQALAAFNEALRDNPKNRDAHYGLGCSYGQLQMHDK